MCQKQYITYQQLEHQVSVEQTYLVLLTMTLGVIDADTKDQQKNT